MFCPNCGKELPDGSAFCLGCGSPLQQNQQQNVNMPQNTYMQNGMPNNGGNMQYGMPNMQSNMAPMPNIAPPPGVDPNSEYEIYKGYAQLVKGALNLPEGRLELTNKSLKFYGRSVAKTGCLFALAGIFSFLIPYELMFDFSIDDIVAVYRGQEHVLVDTFVIKIKDGNDYRFKSNKSNQWIQLIQCLLNARNNKQ